MNARPQIPADPLNLIELPPPPPPPLRRINAIDPRQNQAHLDDMWEFGEDGIWRRRNN